MEPENIFDKKDGVKIIEKYKLFLQERRIRGHRHNSSGPHVDAEYKKDFRTLENILKFDINNYFEISYNRTTQYTQSTGMGNITNNYNRTDTQYIFKKFIISVEPRQDITYKEEIRLIIHNIPSNILVSIKHINFKNINHSGLSLGNLISFYDKNQYHETKHEETIEKQNKKIQEQRLYIEKQNKELETLKIKMFKFQQKFDDEKLKTDKPKIVECQQKVYHEETIKPHKTRIVDNCYYIIKENELFIEELLKRRDKIYS
jgi:uncharacterized coiled-coil protein SlyX